MAKITFITRAGETIEAEAESGSVMELAVQNNVSGIDGDCGGVCSCATCHVHLSAEDFAKVGPPEAMEQDMLEFDEYKAPTSRLSCQLEISPELDGMILTVANE